jgi:hypothetical protein
MQTSPFQLGLIATLAIGLGFSLSSTDAIGYPAGAAISLGENPVFSTGGHLSGTESRSLAIASEDQAVIITDVLLTASDSSDNCRGNSRFVIQDSTGALASFAVGVSRDSRSHANWQPQLIGTLQSGIHIDPGGGLTIATEGLHEDGCGGSEMEVEYTISGYYAQP